MTTTSIARRQQEAVFEACMGETQLVNMAVYLYVYMYTWRGIERTVCHEHRTAQHSTDRICGQVDLFFLKKARLRCLTYGGIGYVSTVFENNNGLLFYLYIITYGFVSFLFCWISESLVGR